MQNQTPILRHMDTKSTTLYNKNSRFQMNTKVE